MRQPYGSGLHPSPRGVKARAHWLRWKAGRAIKKGLLRPLNRVGLSQAMIEKVIWAKDRIGQEVKNYRVFHPAQTVKIADTPHEMEFLQTVRAYRTGSLGLDEVFVCEVSPAMFYPYLGVVANESFEVFGDSVLLPHRFETSDIYMSFRPRQVDRRSGPVSSIQRIDSYSFWHWFADCLPQIITLDRYMQGEPLTLLMGDNLGGFQRETLKLMLPETMQVEFVPAERWIATDRFILPSYLSGRRSGYIHPGYYEEIRCRIAKGVGLPELVAKPDLRIYLSRGTAGRRRVLNESELVQLLERYGFQTAFPERLSMREQVELFQRAEAIVAPHGGALGGMVFSTHAKLLVLYPEKHPGEYFYTMARSLGLEHYGVTGNWEDGEDSVEDFAVDLNRIEELLAGPMVLKTC